MKKFYLSLFVCIVFYNLANAQCSADFMASANPICTNDSVYFTNLTNGATIIGYDWNFGPGSSIGGGASPAMYGGENPPRVAFTTAGTHTFSLTVTCYSPNPQTCTTTGGFTCCAVPPFFSGITTGGTTTCVPAPPTQNTSTRISSITVLAIPAPAFTSAPASGSICSNAPVNFTYTGTAGVTSYSWNFGAGASPSTSDVQNPQGIVYSIGGNKSVTLTVSNGACEHSVSQTITINPSPTASFSSTAPACTGQNVDFINTGTTGATSYAWNFGVNATPPTSAVENPTGATYSTAGGKTVTLTITQGSCSTSIAQGITIYQSPTATIAAPAPACTNASVNFSSAGSSTGGSWRYSWDFGAGSTPTTSTTANPQGIVYSTAGTKTVSLTVYDNHCSATYTTTITINQTPTSSFISSTPACTGTPVNFTNTGTLIGVTWAWTFDVNGAPSSATPATATTQDLADVVYSTAGGKVVQLITKTAICADTSQQAITIYQSPTAVFTLPPSACTKTGVSFTSSDGSNWTYTWDFGADAIPQGSTAEMPVGVYYTSSGSKMITLTVSDEHCSKTTTQSYIIKATPTAGFSSSAPQCTGLPVNFINTGTTGAGLAWTWAFDAGSAPPTAAIESPTGIIYSTEGEKMVQQIVTNSGTSCADTSIQAITIYKSPTAIFTLPASACTNTDVSFTSNDGTTSSDGFNWTYAWDFGADAHPQGSTGENPQDIFYTSSGSKTITLTVSDEHCSTTTTQTYIIKATPIANAGRDTTICADTSVQIGSANIAGNTYSWFAPITLSSSIISNPVATPIAHITEYVVTVTNAGGCVNKDTIVVTMLDPMVANAGVDVEICRYDSVQIGAGLVEQQIYKWTPAAGLTSTAIPNPIASPDSTTTYKVTVTYSGKACTAVTDAVTVTVHQLPIIEVGTIRYQPSPIDSIMILDSITLGSSVQLIAIGGLQYTWAPPYRLDNVGIFNPIASPDTTTIYVVTGTDIYGCINKDSVKIRVIIPSFWVPTAFSPNGNGENDVFYVRGSGIKNFEMGIFNRWGEQIFISKKIDQGWDGTRPISGEELPAGAYVYYIKGTLTNGDPVNAKGLINLIR